MRLVTAPCLALALLLLVHPAPVHGQSFASERATANADLIQVRPGDVLRIVVWPDGTLGGEFAVEESGFVYLPVLGQVRASGISVARLREELRRGYGEAMKNPVVTVTPVFRVGVLGEVVRPGLYMVDPTHTLLDVIGLAGGFRPDANDGRVRVVREGQVVEVDTERSLRTGEDLNALLLRSGDRIVVPRKRTITREGVRTVMFALQSAILVASLFERLSR